MCSQVMVDSVKIKIFGNDVTAKLVLSWEQIKEIE